MFCMSHKTDFIVEMAVIGAICGLGVSPFVAIAAVVDYSYSIVDVFALIPVVVVAMAVFSMWAAICVVLVDVTVGV